MVFRMFFHVESNIFSQKSQGDCENGRGKKGTLVMDCSGCELPASTDVTGMFVVIPTVGIIEKARLID